MNGGIIGRIATRRQGVITPNEIQLGVRGLRRRVLDLHTNAGNNYVSCGTYEPIPDGVFTMMGWLKIFSLTASVEWLVKSDSWSTADFRFANLVFLASEGTYPRAIALSAPAGAASTYKGVCPTGTWVFLTTTRDSGGNANFYINASDALIRGQTSTSNLGTDSGSLLRIGGSVNRADIYAAEFSIFNRVLSQAEIKKAMFYGLTGAEADLKCYWPMNGHANDLMGNASGTLQNNATWVVADDLPMAA